MTDPTVHVQIMCPVKGKKIRRVFEDICLGLR